MISTNPTIANTTVLEILQGKFMNTPVLPDFVNTVQNFNINEVNNFFTEHQNNATVMSGIKFNGDKGDYLKSTTAYYGFNNGIHDPKNDKYRWSFTVQLSNKSQIYEIKAHEIINTVQVILDAIHGKNELPNEITLTHYKDKNAKIIISEINSDKTCLEILNVDFSTIDKEGITHFIAGMIQDVLLAYNRARYFTLKNV